MKLSKAEREAIRVKFGGRCAYCGIELTVKWHVDHVEAVVRIPGEVREGLGDLIPTVVIKPRLLYPENDHRGNLFPACIRCNILKCAANIEGFRSILTYFARSIPSIKTYSHVHHLMRFGKLAIDSTPVVFWFEKYTQAKTELGE